MAQVLLSPESSLPRKDHLTTAFRAGVMIPGYDAATAAVEAQPPGKSIERRCVVADDPAYYKRLDRMAVGTAHAHDVLAHEACTFIVVAFIAALLTTICFSLCHSYSFTSVSPSIAVLPLIASMTSVATSLAHPASMPTSIRIYSRSGFLVVRTN